jgi:hypothetical protein
MDTKQHENENKTMRKNDYEHEKARIWYDTKQHEKIFVCFRWIKNFCVV